MSAADSKPYKLWSDRKQSDFSSGSILFAIKACLEQEQIIEQRKKNPEKKVKTFKGDNHIQNFHLGRYIVRYTVGYLVLRWCGSGVVKCDSQAYIRRYTSPNENFKYGYPHSNALLQFRLELEGCMTHDAARHTRKCYVIHDVKLFPTVYHRIYCRKLLTLSNQKTC